MPQATATGSILSLALGRPSRTRGRRVSGYRISFCIRLAAGRQTMCGATAIVENRKPSANRKVGRRRRPARKPQRLDCGPKFRRPVSLRFGGVSSVSACVCLPILQRSRLNIRLCLPGIGAIVGRKLRGCRRIFRPACLIVEIAFDLRKKSIEVNRFGDIVGQPRSEVLLFVA
jgi:hypothetical protein